jgi:hypothetical protein
MNKKYNYELIRDYLYGRVDKKTADEVGAHIRTDDITRNIALGIVLLDKMASDEEGAQQYLDSFEQKQLARINLRDQFRFSMPVIAKVAATVILFASASFIVYWFIQPSINDLLEKELKTAYTVPMLTRGDGTSTLDKAFQLYVEKKYEMAAQQFQISWQNDSTQTIALFYGGLSLLYANKDQAALVLLQHSTLKSSRFEQQAKWYSALALMKSGNQEAAKDLLNDMATRETHFKAAEAHVFLEKLK